jgi:hypothetical protein
MAVAPDMGVNHWRFRNPEYGYIFTVGGSGLVNNPRWVRDRIEPATSSATSAIAPKRSTVPLRKF